MICTVKNKRKISYDNLIKIQEINSKFKISKELENIGVSLLEEYDVKEDEIEISKDTEIVMNELFILHNLLKKYRLTLQDQDQDFRFPIDSSKKVNMNIFQD